MKIFAIEKELRVIKNRGYFPVPQITPQDNKVETTRDKDKILEAVDEEVTATLTYPPLFTEFIHCLRRPYRVKLVYVW